MEKTNSPDRKKSILLTVITYLCIMAAAFIIRLLPMPSALPLRMIISFARHWLLLGVAFVIIAAAKIPFSELGFTKENLPDQILMGVLCGFLTSLFFTVIPLMLGNCDISPYTYNEAWKFIYEILQKIFAVGLAEEIIFRGFIFNRALEIKNSRIFAVIISSVLFGLFHISGGILQIFITFIIGVLFCLYREKLKNCTLLSLIICHGLYDWLIIFIGSVNKMLNS